MPGVTKTVPAKTNFRLQRVCAYVRVSTCHDGQLLSLEAQTEYYTQRLSSRPGYIFAGIYSDEGVSGSKEERPGLDAMMAAARDGKIDLIVTKSISRFARNTLFFLRSVRALTDLGVAVYFEKENINSMSREGELMLSLYAALAEDEREQVCSNVRWSIRRKYENGESLRNPSRVYGYKEGPDRQWLVDEAQAETVRRIYRRYLDGALPVTIADELTADGIPTDTPCPWSAQRIRRMLRNERYKGDCVLQKSHIDEHGKQTVNRGGAAKYYVADANPPIVSNDVWERANARLSDRARKSFPFSGRLHCPICGSVMRRVKSRWCVMWKCGAYMEKGKAVCPGIPLRESTLYEIAGEEHRTGHWTVKEVGNEYRLVPYGTN